MPQPQMWPSVEVPCMERKNRKEKTTPAKKGDYAHAGATPCDQDVKAFWETHGACVPMFSGLLAAISNPPPPPPTNNNAGAQKRPQAITLRQEHYVHGRRCLMSYPEHSSSPAHECL
eukprot:scaffold95760_cov20-Tisochrysis_lutea.AAC.4